MSDKNKRSLSYRKEPEKNLFEQISHLAKTNAPEREFQALADSYLMDVSVPYSTATFYDFLRPGNTGHKIRICNGTACMIAGTQKKLTRQAEEIFDKDEIGHATCLGHCHSNSAFMYRNKTYTLPEEVSLKDFIEENNEGNNVYHVVNTGKDILTGNTGPLQDYYSEILDLVENHPVRVEENMRDSGLRGRGGAGFPFYIKWNAVKSQPSEKKFIVCNADEGDPGAFSDMYLLEQQPHKVLLGMYIAGRTAGADEGILYIRGEYPHSITSVKKAIETAEQMIPDFRFRIIEGQGSYVCGEETALLNSIEGLRPEVRVRPPYPAQEGLYGKPTLLSNVETFANLPWIIIRGGKAFAELGKGKSTGTKLVSLDWNFVNPGVYEVEMGIPLKTLFHEIAGGFVNPVKAVQIGGPLGGIVPVNRWDGLTLDFETLSEAGFLLGHAGVVSIPEDFPMMEMIQHLMKFTADESCGKCYPCRIGSYRGYEMTQKALQGTYKIDKKLFSDLLDTLEWGSLCALGGGLPLPVRNILAYFSDEIEKYFSA